MKKNDFSNISSSIVAELAECILTVSSIEIDVLVDQLLKSKRIFCFGVGRSGIILSSFCMRLNHLGLEAYYVGGIPCPAATNEDLFLTVSGSGETGSVLSYASQAKEIGCSIACITSNTENPLANLADSTVNITAPAGLVNSDSKISRQPMRTLFEQTAFFVCESLSLILQDKLNVSELKMAQRHANIV